MEKYSENYKSKFEYCSNISNTKCNSNLTMPIYSQIRGESVKIKFVINRKNKEIADITCEKTN